MMNSSEARSEAAKRGWDTRRKALCAIKERLACDACGCDHPYDVVARTNIGRLEASFYKKAVFTMLKGHVGSAFWDSHYRDELWSCYQSYKASTHERRKEMPQ